MRGETPIDVGEQLRLIVHISDTVTIFTQSTHTMYNNQNHSFTNRENKKPHLLFPSSSLKAHQAKEASSKRSSTARCQPRTYRPR